MMDFVSGVLEQGLIFGVMAIGVYITYRILDFPDLSVEGSFPLGAAVTAFCLTNGISPYLAVLISLAAGAAAGVSTGLLHVKLGISSLLSGILVMIGMYSINLRIMEKSNVPLFRTVTIFSGNIPALAVILIFVLSVKIILDLFLKTRLGFLLKATGDNHQLVTSLGVDTGITRITGLMISNGFVAVSGSMMAQYQRFSDVGMGSGVIIMGLASVILGEAIFKRIPFMLPTTMAAAGAILYRLCTALALKLGFPPTDLKLITSLIVIAALSINMKGRIFSHRKSFFMRGGSHAGNTRAVEGIPQGYNR
jgi:putative ABC transport system permease protein